MKALGRRFTAYLVMGATSIGILAASPAALAGTEGKKNTAKVLTGVAAYHLLKGHVPEAIVSGGAAYYAWQRAKAPKHHHRVLSHRVLRHRHHRHHEVSAQIRR